MNSRDSVGDFNNTPNKENEEHQGQRGLQDD